MHETLMYSSFQKDLTSKITGLAFQYELSVLELHFSHSDKVHQTISPQHFILPQATSPIYVFVCGNHSDLHETCVQKTQRTASKPLNHSALVSNSKMGVTTLSS